MATLVLTTIGGAFGGVFGAMIGAVAGQIFDRNHLFKPKGREGPRIQELTLQTSSYGTPIAKLFGSLRVAGSVIWATDLVEHRHREGGKGRSTVTSYSYTASFAVALSARPIRSVGRIWADGKLLRGAAGDWKVRTGFRLHLGGEDQAVDPLIASAEGMAFATAHRGIAYAVFEHLELEEFGNRIPSLSFEVVADAGPVAVGTIVETLTSGGIKAGDAALPVHGYSAYGETVGGAIAALIDAAAVWPRAIQGGYALTGGAGVAQEIRDPATTAGGGSRVIEAADRMPRRIALSHYDPQRDYQAGVQIATDPLGQDREHRIELPAALTASAAKTIAQSQLIWADLGRLRRTVETDWRGLAVSPGTRISIADEPGLWRVIEQTVEADKITLDLCPIAPAALAVPATAGRVVGAPDRLHGETILHAFEIPNLDEGLLNSPRVLIAASGVAPGWRRAALAVRTNASSGWDAIGATAGPAVMGHVVTPIGHGSALIMDNRSRLRVALSHEDMVLHEADANALDAGANVALVGDELIQFMHAEPQGDGEWVLHGLWRGRRGTEAAIGMGNANDVFVLLDRQSLLAVDGRGAAGGQLEVMATGVGDAAPVQSIATLTGCSTLPPSPVDLKLLANPGLPLGLKLVWTRRSRMGWRWLDGVDAPIGEASEAYQLNIFADGVAEQRVTSTVANWTLPIGFTGRVEVRQIGDHGLSPPAIIDID